MTKQAKRRCLNPNGVKDSADMWRTFDGAHYPAWLICPSKERVAAYRAAGIRCRRIKDELFVHHMDTDEAAKIDSQMGNA